ncbi:hypothetical protein BX666DRAFT_2137883 [Dichotomocladium elegans]|nr:hypothetical protein BX666DRAFT_2137883 [Dichotomocladium elegans]
MTNELNHESLYHPHSIPLESIFEDNNQILSPSQFEAIIEDYLHNLSAKKRDKALVDQQRYQLIHQVLKDPRNTAISTAQFRFWVKKMFELQSGTVDLVCHDGKPVAMREQIYAILVKAHTEAHHGGRDKTSAMVKREYSWVPKELVARFVRHCPVCITRRNGGQSPSDAHKSIDGDIQKQSPTGIQNTMTTKHHVQSNPQSFTGAVVPPMLGTPLMQDDSDIASSGPPSTEHGYDASSNNAITSPPRRLTPVTYSEEEEEMMKRYHDRFYGSPSGASHQYPVETLKRYYDHFYKSPPEGSHEYPFELLKPSKITLTAATTAKGNDQAPCAASDIATKASSLPTTPVAATSTEATTALLYQHYYMGVSSCYYPNVLGVESFDNSGIIAANSSTTAAATTANMASRVALDEPVKANGISMLVEPHQMDVICTNLPFNITASSPPDHFTPSITSMSNELDGPAAPQTSRPCYE